MGGKILPIVLVAAFIVFMAGCVWAAFIMWVEGGKPAALMMAALIIAIIALVTSYIKRS